MRILVEEYQYNVADVKDVLYGIDALENLEGKVSVHYVGYYYCAHRTVRDCVFILPKVLLKDVDGRELVFGKYRPEDMLHPDSNKALERVERDFLYKFAVWIYRAIIVYKNGKGNDTSIVYHTKIAQIGRGSRRLSNTYLDILLQLLQFRRDNRSFFLFIVKNIHSGCNKINWTRTISRSEAIIQDSVPIYLRPVNKKRQVNFDEELLVIYYSILHYISDTYGFPNEADCMFTLITGGRFHTYLNGYGCTRLRQIKYKYFSDKALELWNLCYAFFDEARQVQVSTEKKEYLLVKSFYIVFEAIIDELIGDNPLPDGMEKRQDDGKIVDHLYTAKSLIEGKQSPTYYIGDSKYYKMGHSLGSESVYKQYTYAKNVIQYNINLWNNEQAPSSGIRLRDDVTEGYDIIPNFFISAKMDENFDYANDGIAQTDRRTKRHPSFQFKNRLFDRDTLLLFHYDVNFLYVLSLYARNNAAQKSAWKTKIRLRFRSEIQDWLQQDYDFYAMKARQGVDAEEYFKAHFQEVLGKTYTPYAHNGIFSLALEKSDPDNNDALLTRLRHYFIVEPCKLGDDPAPIITAAQSRDTSPIISTGKDGVLMVMMENYDAKAKNFITTGKIAIGIKSTKESMEIVQHISEIGYVLFHVRKIAGQHLFTVTNSCKVIITDEIESDRYPNINTSPIYISVDIDPKNELAPTLLDSTRKSYTKTTRYDAQFARIGELISQP